MHPENQVYRAFADRCTHNGKELDYDHERQEIRCVSRKSRFDLEGHLLKGPATGGLAAYSLQQHDDQLVIDIS